jgi:hypothetical protein
MRPRHPHAAESGVGKHTARESERVQACAAGKERVTNAHPHTHTNQELSCKARLEAALSRVRFTGSFDPCADAVTPEGFGCYCADQNAVAVSGGTTPPKGPARRTSRARNGIVTAGRERT